MNSSQNHSLNHRMFDAKLTLHLQRYTGRNLNSLLFYWHVLLIQKLNDEHRPENY